MHCSGALGGVGWENGCVGDVNALQRGGAEEGEGGKGKQMGVEVEKVVVMVCVFGFLEHKKGKNQRITGA